MNINATGLDKNSPDFLQKEGKYMYSILIINSDNIYDYTEDLATGIRYNDINQEGLDFLLKISLKENYSVVVQRNDEEV